MRQWIGSSLVQAMACRLLISIHYLNPWQLTVNKVGIYFLKIESKRNNARPGKCIWNVSTANRRPLYFGLDVITLCCKVTALPTVRKAANSISNLYYHKGLSEIVCEICMRFVNKRVWCGPSCHVAFLTTIELLSHQIFLGFFIKYIYICEVACKKKSWVLAFNALLYFRDTWGVHLVTLAHIVHSLDCDVGRAYTMRRTDII